MFVFMLHVCEPYQNPLAPPVLAFRPISRWPVLQNNIPDNQINIKPWYQNNMNFHVFSCQFRPPGLLPTEAFLLWPSILNVIYYHKSMVTRPESLSNQHHEQELPQAHRTAICWAVSMGNFTCTALCFSFVKVLVTYDASFVQENSANAMVASSCKVSCVPFTSIWCALKNAELPLTMRRNEPAEVHVNTDMLRTCLICWHAACRSLETITAVQTTDLSRATSDGRLFLQRFVTNEWWHVTNEQLNVCWSLCVCR